MAAELNGNVGRRWLHVRASTQGASPGLRVMHLVNALRRSERCAAEQDAERPSQRAGCHGES